MTADDLKQQLQLPPVAQIGVVVEDLDRAVSFLESSFGLGPFRVQEAEAPNVWDRGKEKRIKARLAFAELGQVELELIHIVEGEIPLPALPIVPGHAPSYSLAPAYADSRILRLLAERARACPR